ncbi:MAG: CHAT domain-containing protein, partial [Acidobacteria bacterium]|nr:CHAT domain-containing protein [Acidobacteriota bacterium]
LANIARVERNQGNLSAAKEKVDIAVSLIESLRSSVVSRELRTSYFATVRQTYELSVDILMQLDKEQPTHGHNVKAFEISERARARSLLETLNEAGGDIREGVDLLLLQRERSLELALNGKARRRTQLVANGNSEEAGVVDREIDQLTTEYAEVRSRIRAQSPQYAALTQPQTLGLKTIQSHVLDDDSLLLEYMLGDERSYVWAVARTEVTSYQLPPRVAIEMSAKEVHSSLIANQPLPGETFEQLQSRVAKASEQLPSQIASLSKILLGPVVDKLGTKRLLIVPDGILQYIPFQILNTASGARPLVVDHEIVNEPSASTLALLLTETKTRKAASRSVAV